MQWLVLLLFALSVQRNGWLFYQGGDQTWFYTSAWELSHGRIPETMVGYLWPYVFAPLAFLAGPDFLDGLPVIVLLQVLVLGPIALLCTYFIAARIGGRLLGYLAAGAWIAAPFLVQPLFVDRYHERWNEQTLPQVLGLTALGDYPSMVLVLVAALFVVRAIDGAGRGDVLAAGVVTGFAIGLKPANGLFVFAPLVAFALVRRWRAGLEFALALVPAVVTLVLWKYRGTGISILALEPRLLAAEQVPHPSQVSWWEQARDFVPLDREQLNQQFLGFREYFWSARLLEYLPVAGAIAVARRSVPKAAFLAVWLSAFFVVKGSSPAVNVETREHLAAADARVAGVLLPRRLAPAARPGLGDAARRAVRRAAARRALATAGRRGRRGGAGSAPRRLCCAAAVGRDARGKTAAPLALPPGRARLRLVRDRGRGGPRPALARPEALGRGHVHDRLPVAVQLHPRPR